MSSVPVLLYHHIAPDREVTPEGFENQLLWMKQHRYRSLSTQELYDHLSGKCRAPERSVLLTFDDGYSDNWVYAFPLLKKHGLKALIFVVTGCIPEASRPRLNFLNGGKIPDTRASERAPEGFLTWQELKAMTDSGLVEIGSHTHTHKRFLQKAAYDNLEIELEQSRQEIESRLGRWSGALAWPWGEFQKDWLEILPRTGYRMAFTTQVGPNLPGTDPLAIRRFKVQHGGVGWLSRRLWIYRNPVLGEAYGRLYGMDRNLKKAVEWLR